MIQVSGACNTRALGTGRRTQGVCRGRRAFALDCTVQSVRLQPGCASDPAGCGGSGPGQGPPSLPPTPQPLGSPLACRWGAQVQPAFGLFSLLIIHLKVVSYVIIFTYLWIFIYSLVS